MRALIPAYAFGATDEDETRFVDAYLSECPEALADLESFRALNDAMPDMLPDAGALPPPDLEQRILGQIDAPASSDAAGTPGQDTPGPDTSGPDTSGPDTSGLIMRAATPDALAAHTLRLDNLRLLALVALVLALLIRLRLLR